MCFLQREDTTACGTLRLIHSCRYRPFPEANLRSSRLRNLPIGYLLTVKPDRESSDGDDAVASGDRDDPKRHPTGEKQAQINREDDPPA